MSAPMFLPCARRLSGRAQMHPDARQVHRRTWAIDQHTAVIDQRTAVINRRTNASDLRTLLIDRRAHQVDWRTSAIDVRTRAIDLRPTLAGSCRGSAEGAAWPRGRHALRVAGTVMFVAGANGGVGMRVRTPAGAATTREK